MPAAANLLGPLGWQVGQQFCDQFSRSYQLVRVAVALGGLLETAAGKWPLSCPQASVYLREVPKFAAFAVSSSCLCAGSLAGLSRLQHVYSPQEDREGKGSRARPLRGVCCSGAAILSGHHRPASKAHRPQLLTQQSILSDLEAAYRPARTAQSDTCPAWMRACTSTQ